METIGPAKVRFLIVEGDPNQVGLGSDWNPQFSAFRAHPPRKRRAFVRLPNKAARETDKLQRRANLAADEPLSDH